MADREPLTVDPDDLIVDISEQIKDVHYRAAVAVDARNRPVGLLTRSDLVSPKPAARDPRRPRRGRAERARRRAGRDRRDPRPPPHRLDRDADPGHRDLRPGRLDRDADHRALRRQRDRADGLDGDPAALRDPLRHGPAQLADDDRPRPGRDRLPRGPDRRQRDRSSGARCSTRPPTSPRSRPREIVTRDAKEYTLASGETISIAQIETVGTRVLERRDELAEAIAEVRERNDYALAALMVTDILDQRTMLVTAGDDSVVEPRLRRGRRRRPVRAPRRDEPQEAGRADPARRLRSRSRG